MKKIFSVLRVVSAVAFFFGTAFLLITNIYQHQLFLAMWQGIALVWFCAMLIEEQFKDRAMKAAEGLDHALTHTIELLEHVVRSSEKAKEAAEEVLRERDELKKAYAELYRKAADSVPVRAKKKA